MKQKDIALIIIIVFISAIISIFVSKALIVPQKNRQQKVEVVGAITSDFPTPDNKYFNQSSVDPTQLIIIGNNSNPQPFNNQSH